VVASNRYLGRRRVGVARSDMSETDSRFPRCV
jgi:hypothetical protein